MTEFAVVCRLSPPGSVRGCERLRRTILAVPRSYESVGRASHQANEALGIPLVRHLGSSPRWLTRATKRGLDIVLAGLLLVLVSPLLVGVAAASRVRGGPGVLYHQERVRLDGRLVTVRKIRSLRALDDVESATSWTIPDDRRVGRVRRVLRKPSLDELPQLQNVLVGGMSMVGARLERPSFVESVIRSISHYQDRRRVHAGLTGWAQIYGLRGDISVADRVRFDNNYVVCRSTWMDRKILVHTSSRVVRTAVAHQPGLAGEHGAGEDRSASSGDAKLVASRLSPVVGRCAAVTCGADPGGMLAW